MNILPPLRFKPWIREMVWGSHRLQTVLGRTLPSTAHFGESWELSDHPSLESQIASSPWSDGFVFGTLRKLMAEMPESLLGKASPSHHGRFPLLVKWLDAADWLSVQVHPDSTVVKNLLPNEGSKTEAWFILQASPESRIWAGLKSGVSEATLREAMTLGTSSDCLHCYKPKPGQFLFLPAGTVHAVGGGVLMAEIQQTSDATFRLFDWNRLDSAGQSRQLHIEESIASIHWKKDPCELVSIPGFGNWNDSFNLKLVECPFFRLSYLRENKSFAFGGDGKAKIIMVVGGKGQGIYNGRTDSLKLGDTILIPASAEAMDIHPDPGLELWIGEPL